MIHPKSLKFFRQEKRIDLWLLILSIFLTIFGIIMIFDASNVLAFENFNNKYYFIKDQLIWSIIGLILLIIMVNINYKSLYQLAVPAMLLTILSLIAVLIPGIGIKIMGARRWLGFREFSFQPSELAKLSLILYLSSWLSSKEKGRFWSFMTLFLLVVGLVILQPDLGTSIILSSIFLILYFISGGSIWHFFLLIPLAILGTVILAVTSPYRYQRLLTFFNPDYDPLGASYHIRQILISFGSGGFWGLGLGASRQKYQFLPEATTDSIFAIVGEELGFVGSFTIIILYLILLYRIYKIAVRAPDKYSSLLAGGILALFGFQIIINLGSMVTVFPLTGVPLPFLSYGGSNLVVSLVAIGIVLNISKAIIHKK